MSSAVNASPCQMSSSESNRNWVHCPCLIYCVLLFNMTGTSHLVLTPNQTGRTWSIVLICFHLIGPSRYCIANFKFVSPSLSMTSNGPSQFTSQPPPLNYFSVCCLYKASVYVVIEFFNHITRLQVMGNVEVSFLF